MVNLLIYWNLLSLQKSSVDKIIVATDSNQIKNTVLSFSFSKVEVYNRNYENATDDASSESVMLEYIESVNLQDSDTFMLVQATSPFTQTNHFDEALELLQSFDSVVSCSIIKRFFGKKMECRLIMILINVKEDKILKEP